MVSPVCATGNLKSGRLVLGGCWVAKSLSIANRLVLASGVWGLGGYVIFPIANDND